LPGEKRSVHLNSVWVRKIGIIWKHAEAETPPSFIEDRGAPLPLTQLGSVDTGGILRSASSSGSRLSKADDGCAFTTTMPCDGPRAARLAAKACLSRGAMGRLAAVGGSRTVSPPAAPVGAAAAAAGAAPGTPTPPGPPGVRDTEKLVYGTSTSASPPFWTRAPCAAATPPGPTAGTAAGAGGLLASLPCATGPSRTREKRPKRVRKRACRRQEQAAIGWRRPKEQGCIQFPSLLPLVGLLPAAAAPPPLRLLRPRARCFRPLVGGRAYRAQTRVHLGTQQLLPRSPRLLLSASFSLLPPRFLVLKRPRLCALGGAARAPSQPPPPSVGALR